jgi:hypothetical protein
MYGFAKSKKLDDEILIERSNFTKVDILSELFYENILLPDYFNQNQFNEEMLKLIPRLEKSIEKFIKDKAILLIKPINTRRLLWYLNQEKIHRLA